MGSIGVQAFRSVSSNIKIYLRIELSNFAVSWCLRAVVCNTMAERDSR